MKHCIPASLASILPQVASKIDSLLYSILPKIIISRNVTMEAQ